jgi:hypothetical protein
LRVSLEVRIPAEGNTDNRPARFISGMDDLADDHPAGSMLALLFARKHQPHDVTRCDRAVDNQSCAAGAKVFDRGLESLASAHVVDDDLAPAPPPFESASTFHIHGLSLSNATTKGTGRRIVSLNGPTPHSSTVCQDLMPVQGGVKNPMMFVTRLKVAAAIVAAIALAVAGGSALATKVSGIEPGAGALQQRSPAAAAGSHAADAPARKGITLEEAIERSLREHASQCARFGIPAAEAERLARIETARPQVVVEAMYQDTVRNQIDAVYKSFVGVEAMQERLHRASADLARWDRLLEATQMLVQKRIKPADDVDRIRTARDAARSKRAKAISALREAKAALGSLLDLPAKERETLVQ